MCGYDNEDIKMFIRDCVIQAIKGYRFGNKSFNTYYSAIAYRNVIALYRKVEGTYDERYNQKSIDLSDSSIEERFVYKEESKREIDLMLILEKVKDMTEYDNKILELYLKGNSYSEIAEKLNIKTKKVCNHLQKIKVKLKKWVRN